MMVVVVAFVAAEVLLQPRSPHRLLYLHPLLLPPTPQGVERLGQPGLRPCHASQAEQAQEHVHVRGQLGGHVDGHVRRQQLP